MTLVSVQKLRYQNFSKKTHLESMVSGDLKKRLLVVNWFKKGTFMVL